MFQISEQKYGDIYIITLQNDDLILKVSNFGCSIISLYTKDKNNIFEDIVLGFDSIDDYKNQDKYIGAVVGRCANRISNGSFSLNNKEYKLAKNNGPNHLHGGINGFDKKIFKHKILDNGVEFFYLSKNGEEAYPGNLELKVSYILNKNSILINYNAVSDEDTIINLTNHTYFNLSGKCCDINNHFLKINAEYFGEIDENGLATGKLSKVEDTPFDFRKFNQIGIGLSCDNPQIKMGQGYDHPFMLSDGKNQIELWEKESSRRMIISTDMPCVQLYTANYLDGNIRGKSGWYYNARDGVCLETQCFPNSINNGVTDVILRKNTEYNKATSWTFDILSK